MLIYNYTQLNDVGCAGIIKWYDDKWNVWICYDYCATVSSDWAWEWEVFARSWSVLCKDYLAGICVIIKGRPCKIPMTAQWKKKLICASRDQFETDTKYDELVPNPHYNTFAIVNAAIARYWDEKRETVINALKLAAIQAGNGDKWLDKEYEQKIRENIARKLHIPTIWPSAPTVWGYNFEIFHCTCGITKNVVKGNYILTFYEYEWTTDEITDYASQYGLAATTQQHSDWMDANPTRERNFLFNFSSNGHGYKKIVQSMPRTILKCGKIAYQRLINLFNQYKNNDRESDFNTAQLFIESGELVHFNLSESQNNNSDNNNRVAAIYNNDGDIDIELNYATDSDVQHSDENNNNNNSNNNNNDNEFQYSSSSDENSNNNNNNNNRNDEWKNDPNQVIDTEIVERYAIIAKFAIRYVFVKYIQEVLYYMWKSKFNKPADNSTPPEITRMQNLAKKAGWIALQGDDSLVCFAIFAY